MRSRIADGALATARVAAAGFAVLVILLVLPLIGTHAHGRAWDFVTIASLVLLAATVIGTYVIRRTPWPEPVVTPALVAIGGSGLVDPLVATGLATGVLVAQSLYGSRVAWAVRSIGLVAAVPVAVAISPLATDRVITWHSRPVLVIGVQLAVVAVVARALHAALDSRRRADERDAVLARTGSQLLGCTDVLQVRAVGSQAAERLCEIESDTAMMILERRDGEISVVGCAGMRDTMLGAAMPGSIVTGLNPMDSATVRPATTEVERVDLGAPDVRHWRAIGLGTTDVDRFLFVGGARPVPDAAFDGFRTLAHQLVLAEANCVSHAQLYHQANHDQLTSLPTRALLFRRLAGAVDQNVEATLLIVDVDDFKQVNDAYGHGAGDELLIEVAERIKEFAGPDDVAARFGGDEFALLLTDLRDPAEADQLADGLCHRLLDPVRLTTGTLSVGASLGVAASEPGLTAGDIMRCADIAMHAAKAQGKSRVERFSAARHGDIAQYRLLEEHLAHAIERSEIVLHYEPLLDLATGECVGFEALMRWQHPMLGVLQPDEFLPVAERTGLVNVVGTHALRAACRQAVAWNDIPNGQRLRIAVNVPPRQLVDPTFAQEVGAVLRETGLPGERLTLELVESEHLDDRIARAQLSQVAAMGVRLAIDDFGTGYVSLASLRSFPLHQLKIEAGFLSEGDDDVRTGQLLQMVSSIGEILDLETLAQGVQNPRQAARLRVANVALAEGPLFGDPMPGQDVPHWLHANAQAVSSGTATSW